MVFWSSKKQACVALSSIEAEHIADATGSCEAVWFKKLLLRNDEKELIDYLL